MDDKYLTIKRFKDAEEANEFINFLKSKNIRYVVEDASPDFDPSFTYSKLDKEIHIKVLQSEFELVEVLHRNDLSKVSIKDMPDDYYLFDFTNEELMEILMKPDEWGSLDYNLSKKILRERGKEIDTEFLETLRKNRNKELSAPEKNQKTWINAGYIFAFLGGLIGIFIGWHLLTFKKTLPDGKRVYGYVESDRRHGIVILIISIIFVTLSLIIKFIE